MDSNLPPPVPKIRESKKPIPTPRRSIIKGNLEQIAETTPSPLETIYSLPELPESNVNGLLTPLQSRTEIGKPASTESLSSAEETTNTNTLTKRVSSASKQLADDISQLVQERKRAVIEGTRQSVRRIARRFSSSSQSESASEEVPPPEKGEEDSISLFSAITFSSPLSATENIYNNVESDHSSVSSDENSITLPPPSHPPPPPPDESLYDAPLSIASSSNSGNSINLKSKTENYESIFPRHSYSGEPSFNNADKSSFLCRSESWKLYDSVSRDNGYTTCADQLEKSLKELEKKIDNLDINLNVSKPERPPSLKPSVYENHQILSPIPPQRPENHQILSPVPPQRPPRASKSVIVQFDPIMRQDSLTDSVQGQNDIRLLEEMLQGDLYGNISNAHTFDEWSISNESESEEVISPPTPPMRVDSLPGDEQEAEKEKTDQLKSRSNWFTQEGVSGKWAGAWIVLAKREFSYAIDGQPVKHMDLRKARCIVLQSYADGDNPRTNDKGPNMLIDCPNMALYLRMWTSRETKVMYL
uniref:Uncharacterized protein LOC114338918 n=1 Tax=Diabrotica virgifera virgifera TaxID=50390 RepID=A0A6P7G8F7_DIAVI